MTGVATRRISLLTSTSSQVRRPRVDRLQRERVAHLALLAVVNVNLAAGVGAQAIVGQRVERRERARVVERRQLVDALLDLFLGGRRQAAERILELTGARGAGAENGRAQRSRSQRPLRVMCPAPHGDHCFAATSPAAPNFGAVQLPHTHG